MLTSKQRAYLRGLGAVLTPIFQVGKGGISPDLVEAVDAALESRELIKVAILNNCEECDGDVYELCERLASRTHSEPVQVIGHKIVLYRTSKKPKIELPPAKASKTKKVR